MANADEFQAPTRAKFRFGVGRIMEWTVLVALWAAGPFATGSLNTVIAYGFAAWMVTWAIVGRSAWGLSDIGFRRMMAGCSAMLTAGCFGLWCLAGNDEFMPAVLMFTGFFVVFIPIQWGVLWLAVSIPLFLFLIYLFWVGLFRVWDWLACFVESSDKKNQGPLASMYGLLVFLLAVPLALQILFGKCYHFEGHGEGRDDVHHLAAHCGAHVLMLILGIAVTIWFAQKSLASSAVPSPIAKLVCWGYLSLYASMLQLSLFTFAFYFP